MNSQRDSQIRLSGIDNGEQFTPRFGFSQIKQPTNENSDIQHLLTYINQDQNQKLNLIPEERLQLQTSMNGEKFQNNTFSQQFISNYIKSATQNNSQSQEKSTLTNLIDLGIRMLSKIKNVTSIKVVVDNKSKKQDQNGQLLKQLFFGKESKVFKNSKGSQKNKQISNQQKMKYYKIQKQLQILSARKDGSNFLLIQSLQEHFKSENDNKQLKTTKYIINQLQIILKELQVSKKKLKDQKSSQKSLNMQKFIAQTNLNKKIQNAWELLNKVSAFIDIKNKE